MSHNTISVYGMSTNGLYSPLAKSMAFILNPIPAAESGCDTPALRCRTADGGEDGRRVTGSDAAVRYRRPTGRRPIRDHMGHGGPQ